MLTMIQAKANTASARTVYAEASAAVNSLLDEQMMLFFKCANLRDALACAEQELKANEEKISDAEPVVFIADIDLQKAELAEKRIAAEANHRTKFDALCEDVLETHTSISLESRGDKWVGVVVSDGFLVNGILYRSPGALAKAHASRITANHPKPTKPGSGWIYINVEDGLHKGKTIEMAFNDHFTF
jgi:hypothetical protein